MVEPNNTLTGAGEGDEPSAVLTRYLRTLYWTIVGRTTFAKYLVARDWTQVAEPKRYLAGATVSVLVVTAWTSERVDTGSGQPIDLYGREAQLLAIAVIIQTLGTHLLLHYISPSQIAGIIRDGRYIAIIRAWVIAIANIILLFAALQLWIILAGDALDPLQTIIFFGWGLLQTTLPIWVAATAYQVSLAASSVGWWLAMAAYFGLVEAFPVLQPA